MRNLVIESINLQSTIDQGDDRWLMDSTDQSVTYMDQIKCEALVAPAITIC